MVPLYNYYRDAWVVMYIKWLLKNDLDLIHAYAFIAVYPEYFFQVS